MIKKFICHKCGSINEIDLQQLDDPARRGDWLECAEPQGFEWKLPAGKITPIVGEPIYITGGGTHLSQKEYIATYGIDPEIALKMMRGMGRVVKESISCCDDLTGKSSRTPDSIRKLMTKLNLGEK
ncbi:MAG: hypothetical protein GKC10_04695 [Methanosarcinales archaeon]|nr:hypothetical protein [Methanosarcinales archaeon]